MKMHYIMQEKVLNCAMGINADNNAQLNGMIRDSKRMFQEYINQNAQKVPEKAKKKGFFSRLFSR